MLKDYENYIHLSRYSNWLEAESRRENFEDTVDRYVGFFKGRFEEYPAEAIKEMILSKSVMPSMRAMKSAGKALERDEVAGYNCSYVAMDNTRAFDEIMYILMCGTGVGFSVESKYTNQLPVINETVEDCDVVINVPDSKIGWATSFKNLIAMLYAGSIPSFNFSAVRPAGARLKTFGGTASGPKPLQELFAFTIKTIKSAAGRRLLPIEVHDIVNKVAEIVIVGGVRRSALISLSDLDDEQIRVAKSGKWWETHPHRALSNNSAAYDEMPGMNVFMKEWLALYESKSGERGIFNRHSATKKTIEHGRRDPNFAFGTNPCGEIILRPNSFCNLSEVVVRSDDTLETLKRKVEIATIIGTYQSTLTNFRYLRSIWRKNAEEERLLGVSLTGIMDNVDLSGKNGLDVTRSILEQLREVAIETNRIWSEKLGINQSVAIGTVKPSGTVSQLVNSASGIHPRYSEYYIRTVRSSNSEILTKFMQDQGVPNEPDIMKPDDTTIFSFPIKSPSDSVFRNDLSAIEQLEHYVVVREAWCEHNPSITVYVKESEWMDVGAWVYKNFDRIGGVSFLPHSDHSYAQAPYQEIVEEDYYNMLSDFPAIDWNKLLEYEDEDTMTSMQELACTAGGCEV